MKSLWLDFKQRPLGRKIVDILLVLFALAGVAILGAWAFFQLGLTNNRGAVDKNYRYLHSLTEPQDGDTTTLTPLEVDEQWALQLGRLAALARLYPHNARMIMQAAVRADDPTLVARMVAAAQLYMNDSDTLRTLSASVGTLLTATPQEQRANVVPWMALSEWEMLKRAIVADSTLIREAGRLTGVEPRLIVGCLVGEQMRLFTSKREKLKQYLGPVKVLNVQSQFSYGVNGIKDKTALAVEEHLTDTASPFYMGIAYEHLLDFETDDHAEERYRRLVDYGNHLYSYLYTGCILHQTMLQWRRAGHDISHRPDVLFTLFNLGFARSLPKADPMPGGSVITIADREYTFAAIGFDFYYSGELADVFPYQRVRFASDVPTLSADDVASIQGNTTNCSRPERGSEYRRDSLPQPAPVAEPVEEPDPFGIDPSQVNPINHIAG